MEEPIAPTRKDTPDCDERNDCLKREVLVEYQDGSCDHKSHH